MFEDVKMGFIFNLFTFMDIKSPENWKPLLFLRLTPLSRDAQESRSNKISREAPRSQQQDNQNKVSTTNP